MRRKNIHSLLTLAADPSEPNVGAAVQPRGWPVSQGGGVSVEKHSRGLHKLHRQEGEGCWCGPCLRFVAEKESSALLLEPQTPLSGVVKTNPGRPNSDFVSELDAQKHPQ